MTLRVACLTVALTLTLGACGPISRTPPSCNNTLANASGKGVDQSAFTYPDGCADIEDLHQRGFRINFDGGPLSSLGVSGANVTDLDLNTVGEYPCGMHSGLRAVGSPSDPENPAYSNGGYDTLNQNTAVEGDCLHGSCTVSVTSPASSGTLKLHFTGNLGRSKANAAFHCDYMSVSFDLTMNKTETLN
ncbi:MAG: hypothetical protein QM765_30565 [Myxococcales bacterium]